MSTNNISKTTTRKILKVIIPFWENLAEEKPDNAIAIIKTVWGSISTKLLGKGYEEVEEDILQHFFRNNDYDALDIFENILKIYSLEFDSVVTLIESIVDVSNFMDLGQINNLSTFIDYELGKDGLRLVITGYRGLPVSGHLHCLNQHL